MPFRYKPGAVPFASIPTSTLEFFIDVDTETGREMVMVNDTQQVATYAPLLAHHIARFEEIIRDLALTPTVAVAPAVPAPQAART